MVTNTYLPHVGGVARSVSAFTDEYRKLGHRVVVLAPTFENTPEGEEDVVRIPAIQNFNGSDFSVQLPVPPILLPPLNTFKPDVVHSHHPFLLGSAAVRLAALHNVPLIFTHHTMYERYTHYVPGDSVELKRFVVQLSTGFANLSQRVFAPSASVRDVLVRRGVASPIDVVPTGVDTEFFAKGDRIRCRTELRIPHDAFVVGHVGRLAPEKNLLFLSRAIKRFLERNSRAHALIVGTGPSQTEMQRILGGPKLRGRVHFAGSRSGPALADAFRAMDVFAFASHTETQGMVLTEAMAAGVPVVAVDAPGAREVVRDGGNGCLLERESCEKFCAALEWISGRPGAEYKRLQDEALSTAEEFSQRHCAEKALAGYAQAVEELHSPQDVEDSVWSTSIRLIETELSLVSNTADAASRALLHSRIFASRPVRWIRRMSRRVRKIFDRPGLAIRLLGLRTYDDDTVSSGVVLIQIDGLSFQEFERGLSKRRLPFLAKLLRQNGYELRRLYSGLPSTTPAAQAELFYGVRGVVPSFQFFDREAKQLFTMFDPSAAKALEDELSLHTEGLLSGGSCYSDIYCGGAEEAHFCPAAFGWGEILRSAHPFKVGVLLLWHGWTVVRALALIAIEVVIAIVDVFRGLLSGESLGKELKFILARVSVVIFLREFITAGAVVDAERGVPVIHLNFLGYDEQAHRRGPSSAFAHWTLKGIDRSIQRIWRAASNSARRDYSIIIYSDHGQESVRSFALKCGKTLQEVVRESITGEIKAPTRDRFDSTAELHRAQWLGGVTFQRMAVKPKRSSSDGFAENVMVAAMGPVGHIYLESPNPELEREIAQQLVSKYEIPSVLFSDEDGEVRALTRSGLGLLRDKADEVIGNDHPFAAAVLTDLEALCRNRRSGDVICLGWNPHGESLSFPVENGAHAGPGKKETAAFLLLPSRLAREHPERPEQILRHTDVRTMALDLLGRSEAASVQAPCPRPGRAAKTFRLVTYNVHSCIGIDRKLSPARIARLLAQTEPDVIALQELDVRRPRTGMADQAHVIGKLLRMDLHFHPAMVVEEELYGDALLSSLDMEVRKAGALPTANGKRLEPRGAIMATIDVDGVPVTIINTHLGLLREEREKQIAAILGPEWLGSVPKSERVILCGDINEIPGTPLFSQLTSRLRDVQLVNGRRSAKNTWPSRYPFRRIDHVFASEGLRVRSVDVPRNELTRVASDHLPIIVDFEVV